MKKSFFFAAVAAMFMVSCAQVEIDSEAGKLSQKNEGQTVIGAEIVDTRTVLGTPESNVYPINWQAGDAICVNNVASVALTASDFSGKTATFTFGEELTSPYWAVYPASAAGTFGLEGADITVPSVQEYVAGSFDPDAAIMLGTGTEGISFVNAMAYIKVKTTGTEKISNVVVTSLGAEAMSGEFTTADFQTIAPKEGGNTSTSVVLVTETPVDAGTDIIVAIPAQTYASGFMISIQSPDGKVYQKKSEKSFAAAAGHMYAVTLEYAPVAPVATLTIDGDVTDWATVPAVTYTLPKGDVMYKSIKKLKATSDDDFVYLYLEFADPGWDAGYSMDLMIDADGDPATGAIVGATQQPEGDGYVPPYTLDGMGMEYYFEHWLHDGTKYNDYVHWGTIYKYREDLPAGQSIFGNNTVIEWGEDKLGGKVLNMGNIINGTGYMEVCISREFFGMCGEKCNVGYKLFQGTTDLGLIPQGKLVNGARQLKAMAPVAMVESSHKPQPEPEEPITIDGDFSDWATAEGVQTYKTPEDALLGDAYEMRFVGSEDYVYVYLDAIDNKVDGNGVTLDFFIDADANPLTGMFMNNQLGQQEGSLFINSGIDWYMQSNLYNGSSYFNLVSPGYFLNCTGNFGKHYGAATVVNHGPECDAGKSFAKIVGTEDGHINMEWRLSRSYFGMTGPQARFGLRYMCPGYTNCGVMPQKPAEDGRFIAADLFTVNLPSKETPKPAVVEPIEIDGSFEDWEDAEGVATYDVPEDAKYAKLYTMKAVASDKYLYVYANAEGNLGVYTRAYLVLDTDANASTGFNLLQGSDKIVSGGEFYIDTQFNQNGAYINQTAPSAAYLWNGGDNVTWKADNAIDKKALFNMNVSYGRTVYVGTDLLVEWRLDRKTCGVTGTKVGIGLRYQHGWGCVGACPQKSAVSGVYAPDVWHINIPAIAE